MTALLMFSLTPFAGEIGEWAVHYAVHGDFAHASGHSRPGPKDEHGCTPLLHLCACHGTACTAGVERRIEQVQQPLSALDPLGAGNPGRTQDPPPHRPPVA